MTKNGANLQTWANYFLITVATGLVIALLTGWLASSKPLSSTNRTKLHQAVSSLRSYAAESYLLARQYEEGRATNNYAKISALKLQYAVSSLNNQLQEQPVEQDAAKPANQVSQQATDLQNALTDLSRLPNKQRTAELVNKIKGIEEKVSAIQ